MFLKKDLLIEDDILTIYGKAYNQKTHQHHAIQLLYSDSDIIVNDCAFSSGVIINSNTPHFILADKNCLSLFIDPESIIGLSLREIIKNNDVVSFKDIDITLDKEIHNLEENISIIRKTITKPNESLCIDDRILSIISYIELNRDSDMSIDDLADRCNLSKSRFSHLFKQEIGISIQRYLTWKRLYNAAKAIIMAERNITSVALEYGFHDSAHFSKTFKDSFGINLKTILNDLKQ